MYLVYTYYRITSYNIVIPINWSKAVSDDIVHTARESIKTWDESYPYFTCFSTRIWRVFLTAIAFVDESIFGARIKQVISCLSIPLVYRCQCLGLWRLGLVEYTGTSSNYGIVKRLEGEGNTSIERLTCEVLPQTQSLPILTVWDPIMRYHSPWEHFPSLSFFPKHKTKMVPICLELQWSFSY